MNVEDAKVMLEEMGYEVVLISDIGSINFGYDIGEVTDVYVYQDKPCIDLVYYNPVKAGDWIDIMTHDSGEYITSSCII